MKMLLLLVLTLAVRGAEIPKNTHVLLKMVNSISTRTAQEGAQVYMQTASPISDGRGLSFPWGPTCRAPSWFQNAAERSPGARNWRSGWMC